MVKEIEGGYIIAAAGFGELLGLSLPAGTSALEVAVIGVPLLLMAIAVAFSFARGRHHLDLTQQDKNA